MRDTFKNLFYLLFKPFSKIKTSAVSHFLIAYGYFIKTEALYNRSDVKTFDDRIPMHEYMSSVFIPPDEKIHFMEFGVYKGQTYAIWVAGNQHPGSKFAGFDTFTGLPEDWGNEKKGSYSAQGKLPDISDNRSRFEVGLIQDTLPLYLPAIAKEDRKVIHIDVDLYNASLVTLVYLQPLLKAGDIIIFDDFFTFTKTTHEFKAFYDFLDLFKMEYKPIFKCRRGHIAIEIV